MRTATVIGYCPRCGPDVEVGEKTGRCLRCGSKAGARIAAPANGNGASAGPEYEPCKGCRWPGVCTGDRVCWKAAREARETREAAQRGRAALDAIDDGAAVSTSSPQTAPDVDDVDEPPFAELADDDEPATVPLAPGLAEGITITLPEEPALHTRKLLKTLGADFEVDPTAPGSCEHGDAPHDKPGPAVPPRLSSPPRPVVEPGAAAESSASGGASPTPKPKRPPRGAAVATYSRESVIADIQALARELGRPPMVKDKRVLADRAKRYCGSWANAVEAAGYERPRRGIAAKPFIADAAPADPPPGAQADVR